MKSTRSSDTAVSFPRVARAWTARGPRTHRPRGGRLLQASARSAAAGSEAVRRPSVPVAEGDDLVGGDPVDPCAAVRARAGVADLDELLAADLEPPVVAVLVNHAAACVCSSSASVTRTAVPSTTTSFPVFQPFAPVLPVVTATRALPSRLRCFCSSEPVQKANAPSCQTPPNGTACGRPSARTVMIQWSCASVRNRSLAAPGVGSRMHGRTSGRSLRSSCSIRLHPDRCLIPGRHAPGR